MFISLGNFVGKVVYLTTQPPNPDVGPVTVSRTVFGKFKTRLCVNNAVKVNVLTLYYCIICPRVILLYS